MKKITSLFLSSALVLALISACLFFTVSAKNQYWSHCSHPLSEHFGVRDFEKTSRYRYVCACPSLFGRNRVSPLLYLWGQGACEGNHMC